MSKGSKIAIVVLVSLLFGVQFTMLVGLAYLLAKGAESVLSKKKN